MQRRIFSLFILVLILGSFVLSVAAAVAPGADVMPCYNHTSSTSTNFTIKKEPWGYSGLRLTLANPIMSG